MDKFNKMYNQIISEGLADAWHGLIGDTEAERQQKQKEFDKALADKDKEYKQNLNQRQKEYEELKNSIEANAYRSPYANSNYTLEELRYGKDAKSGHDISYQEESRAFAKWLVNTYPTTAAILFMSYDPRDIKRFYSDIEFQMNNRLHDIKIKQQQNSARQERESLKNN